MTTEIHNKPGAILKIRRKQYATVRPWKNAGMSREQFEQILAVLPEGFIYAIQLEAGAERLIAASFGDGGNHDA